MGNDHESIKQRLDRLEPEDRLQVLTITNCLISKQLKHV